VSNLHVRSHELLLLQLRPTVFVLSTYQRQSSRLSIIQRSAKSDVLIFSSLEGVYVFLVERSPLPASYRELAQCLLNLIN
jgi:hypothetical protein